MRGEIALPFGSLFGFLLVLSRVAGAFVFVPIPGIQASLARVRIVLVLAITLALVSLWPQIRPEQVGAGLFVIWLLKEAALGITIGVVVSFVSDAFLLAFQVLGLQAGYTFASTVDPTNNADSTILQIFGQLSAGVFFFSLGLYRAVLEAFAGSLQAHPPGSFTLDGGAVTTVLGLGAGIFSTGVRLALPVMSLMVMVDIALALLARINTHLQLLPLAFPLKMLASLVLLSLMVTVFQRVYEGYAIEMLGAVRRLLGF